MAKKPTISTITTNYNLAQYVNSNFEAIRDHFEGFLSLDGSTPNSMQADLDLNGNSILNAGDIEVEGITVGGITFVPNNVAAIPNWESTWVSGKAYVVNDLVYNAGNSYICVVAHTSGVFSSDLSSGYWELFASKGDSGAGAGDLLSTENLADLADADAALANLGGGSKGIAIFKDTTSEAVRTEIGLGGLATEDILDEDDFASDSATRPPSQQSTKEYIAIRDLMAPHLVASYDGASFTIAAGSEAAVPMDVIVDHDTGRIPGASVSGGDVINLPAGDYYCEWRAVCHRPSANYGASFQTALYDVTGAADLLVGSYSDVASYNRNESFGRGKFTLASTSDIRLVMEVVTSTGTVPGASAKFSRTARCHFLYLWKIG